MTAHQRLISYREDDNNNALTSLAKQYLDIDALGSLIDLLSSGRWTQEFIEGFLDRLFEQSLFSKKEDCDLRKRVIAVCLKRLLEMTHDRRLLLATIFSERMRPVYGLDPVLFFHEYIVTGTDIFQKSSANDQVEWFVCTAKFAKDTVDERVQQYAWDLARYLLGQMKLPEGNGAEALRKTLCTAMVTQLPESYSGTKVGPEDLMIVATLLQRLFTATSRREIL